MNPLLFNSIVFIVFGLLFLRALSKHWKRWEGVRLGAKALILVGASGLFVLIGSGYQQFGGKIIIIAGSILFLIGWLLGVIGAVKHVKVMFAPVDNARAELDPGYNLPFVLCPHCKKASVRIDAPTFRCPVCKQKIPGKLKRSFDHLRSPGDKA